MRGYGFAAVAAATLGFGIATGVALGEDDGYIRGYVSAVAERDYHLRPADIEVQGGVVRINAPQLSADERERLTTAVRGVPGVTDVRIAGTEPAPVAAAPAAAERSTAQDQAADRASMQRPAPPVEIHLPATADDYKLGLLPGKTLFDPLLADPRWPHIAGTFRIYQNDKRMGNDIGGADFGGSLSVFRFEVPKTKEMLSELGLQVGVFSIYDLDSDSHDLVNADYFAALTDTIRVGKFSLIGRVLHQSSHLGDEYLLAHQNDPGFRRVNASYEQVNGIASYDLTPSLRVYGGTGYLFDTDPQDMGNWSVQYGAEYKAPWTFGRHMRPVAAVDFQHKEREDWDLNLSARAGVQFEGAELRGNRLLLMLEYFTGHDPNGQFYPVSTQWWGLGLHWFF